MTKVNFFKPGHYYKFASFHAYQTFVYNDSINKTICEQLFEDYAHLEPFLVLSTTQDGDALEARSATKEINAEDHSYLALFFENESNYFIEVADNKFEPIKPPRTKETVLNEIRELLKELETF